MHSEVWFQNVACNIGLHSINYGLLWSRMACCFGPLGFPSSFQHVDVRSLVGKSLPARISPVKGMRIPKGPCNMTSRTSKIPKSDLQTPHVGTKASKFWVHWRARWPSAFYPAGAGVCLWEIESEGWACFSLIRCSTVDWHMEVLPP